MILIIDLQIKIRFVLSVNILWLHTTTGLFMINFDVQVDATANSQVIWATETRDRIALDLISKMQSFKKIS